VIYAKGPGDIDDKAQAGEASRREGNKCFVALLDFRSSEPEWDTCA